MGTYRGLRTRAQIGMRAPKSVSRNITPSAGGVTIHYGGPRVGITAESPHSRCEATWRGWQRFHMDGHGWADLAYTLGACQHGYLLAGRGAGARTAAQGDNRGNQISYAICWLGGDGDVPTEDALAAIEQGITILRESGNAGRRVWAHQEWHSTSCPGKYLTPKAKAWDGASMGHVTLRAAVPNPKARTRGPFPLPDGHWYGTPDESPKNHSGHWARDREGVRQIQSVVGAGQDGRFGEQTKTAVAAWQSAHKLTADGLVGKVTWEAMSHTG